MKTTDFLAIYGAVLSTSTAVWNYLRTRPKIRVRLIFALETVEGQPLTGLAIFVQNYSAQTVHIANVNLLCPFGSTSLRKKLDHLLRYKTIPYTQGWCFYPLSRVGVEDHGPIDIDPGKSHKIFIKDSSLEPLLSETKSRLIRAVSQDALWRNEYSQVFTYPKAKSN